MFICPLLDLICHILTFFGVLFPMSCQVFSPHVFVIASPPWCVSPVSDSLSLPCVFKPCVPSLLDQIVLSSKWAVWRLFLVSSLCFDHCFMSQLSSSPVPKLYLCQVVRFPGVDLLSDKNNFDEEPPCMSLHYWSSSLYLINRTLFSHESLLMKSFKMSR